MPTNDIEPVLLIRGLRVNFDTEEGLVEAVEDLNLELYQGETLCLVGESGCGKSVTAHSIMQLIPNPPGKIASGEILLQDKKDQPRKLLELSKAELNKLRGAEIAMIFQEPMTALNPVLRIQTQITEALKIHTKLKKAERNKRALSLLKEVGIPAPEEVCKSYPHQLSGGQRQRIVIAIALACKPKVLIADEPTTALDVTIQAQILELLSSLQKSHNMSLILITHDLAVVAEVANRVLVMYAGSIVESADVMSIFGAAAHPYTRALVQSLPSLGEQRPLRAIEGRVPKLIDLGAGCRFVNRCALYKEMLASGKTKLACKDKTPELVELEPGHSVRCHFAGAQKESSS